MELADAAGVAPLKLTPDRRPTMPVPPPVRVLAVEDVTLVAAPGREPALDAFYVGLLRFEREDAVPPARREVEPLLGGDVPRVSAARVRGPLPRLRDGGLQGPVYRGENVLLSFQVHEPLIERDAVRPLGIEVQSLAAVAERMADGEMEFTRQKGIHPGHESLLVQDPGGNWLEVVECRSI